MEVVTCQINCGGADRTFIKYDVISKKMSESQTKAGTPKYKLPVCDTFRADCAYKIISIKLNFLYSKIGTDVPSHMGWGTSVPRTLFTIFLIISLTHYLHDPNYLYFDVPGLSRVNMFTF